MKEQLNLMIGGEAGQGVQSVGHILAKSLARGGYQVFADQDYESRVRGGHNFYRVRAAATPVTAPDEQIDVLLALNEESIGLHKDEVVSSGVIVYDSEKVKDPGADGAFGVPLSKLADAKIMENIAALGAAFGLIDYDITILEDVLIGQFGNDDIGKKNVETAKAGYAYAKDNYKGAFACTLPKLKEKKKRMLLNGNEAIALGAMAAGCRYVSSYPMTPSTSVMEYIAARADEYGIVVMQAEDEVSAINMITGAGYAGARAMTTTSGSGFCLMVEGLGLAGITETPVVIIDAQRPGPAVGLPTRTAQGDLQFAISAHHGDFPRIVLAPATVEDCFWLTVEAFNLADIYQTPVIILTDQFLASSYATVEKFDLSKVTIDRGELYSGDDAGYKRHADTVSGISPRAFPGLGKALVVTDSDEHDEVGHLTESAEITNKMVEKRLRKMSSLADDILEPDAYGEANPDILLIGWGSSHGVLHEVVDILRGEGKKAQMLNLNHVFPLPAEAVLKMMEAAAKTFVVEENGVGQLARLIRTETGKLADGLVLRYDGRPFTPAYVIEALEKEGV